MYRDKNDLGLKLCNFIIILRYDKPWSMWDIVVVVLQLEGTTTVQACHNDEGIEHCGIVNFPIKSYSDQVCPCLTVCYVCLRSSIVPKSFHFSSMTLCNVFATESIDCPTKNAAVLNPCTLELTSICIEPCPNT